MLIYCCSFVYCNTFKSNHNFWLCESIGKQIGCCILCEGKWRITHMWHGLWGNIWERWWSFGEWMSWKWKGDVTGSQPFNLLKKTNDLKRIKVFFAQYPLFTHQSGILSQNILFWIALIPFWKICNKKEEVCH